MKQIYIVDNTRRSVVGERIKARRRSEALSQEGLANTLREKESIAVDQAMVSRWEKGVFAPNDEVLLALARIFKVPPSYLTGELDMETATYRATNSLEVEGDPVYRWLFWDESRLIDSYRRLDDAQKGIVAGVIKAYAEASKQNTEHMNHA